jgi:hypothetical protein
MRHSHPAGAAMPDASDLKAGWRLAESARTVMPVRA